MRPRVLAVGPDRRQRSAFGDRQGGCPVHPTHVEAERMAGSEDAERLSVIRVDGNCLLQQRLRDDIILPGHPPVMRQSPHYQIPGIHTVRRLALGAKALPSIELRLDCGDYGLGDFVLHREHVGQAAVVAFRPDVPSGGDVVELYGDAHAVTTLADTALDHIANAVVLGDLPQMDGLTLVDERRIARDHEEPAQLRQRGDDILANAVRKYSCSGSPLILMKGSTAMAGRSDGGKAGGDCSLSSSGGGPIGWAGSSPFDGVRTVPTKRKPRREMVRICFWSSPLSPTAFRAALMRLVKVDSDTIWPSHTEAIRSSLLRRGSEPISVEPQVFDLLLDRNRFGTAAQLAAVGVKC